jgi:predicted hydrocarbon binding protein
MGKDMRPFFVMPGSALKDLREELQLLNGNDAGRTMERYGFRAGVGLVRTLGLECADIQEAKAIIEQVWTETGLSRMNIEMINETEIVITFKESVEADNGDHCDFTRGYISGIISSLMRRRYDAYEASCISDGAGKCVHVLTPSTTFPTEKGDVLKKDETGRRYLLEPGTSYLVESSSLDAAYQMYRDQVAEGCIGMVLAREYPEKVQKMYGIGEGALLWLSYERGKRYAREPTDIPMIYSEIKNFFEANSRAVVLLSGLEYLISQNNFLKVLKLLQLLNDNVSMTGSMLIIPVVPEALNPQDVKMLERELRVLEID